MYCIDIERLLLEDVDMTESLKRIGVMKVNIMKEMSRDGFSISFSINSIRDKAETRTGTVIDISCTNSSSALLKMSKKKMYSIDIEWLILEEVDSTESLKRTKGNNILESLHVLPGSCVSLAQYSRSDGWVKLYELYRLADWEPMKYNWLAETFHNGSVSFPVRKVNMNFEGVTLRAVSAVKEWQVQVPQQIFVPFNIAHIPTFSFTRHLELAEGVLYPELFAGWESLDNIEADTNTKATYAVIKNVATHLNYNFTLKYTHRFGYTTNGTFDGLAGYIQREEADIAAVGLMMNDDRLLVMDYTRDIIPIRSPLIFRQPALSEVSNIFVLPFESLVWKLSGIVTVMFGFVLSLNLFLKMKLLGQIETDDSSVAEILSVIMAYVCLQGTGLELKPGAGRLALCILSMFCFFLSVSFSAKIVALLQSSAHTVKSLSDLTNGPMGVGMQDVIYNELKFAASTDPKVKKLYKKKILPQGDRGILTADEGIEKVKLGLYAFKVETPWAYIRISEQFQDKEKCDLDELHVFLLPMISMPVQKKSGYREHITRSISRQKEVGIIKRIDNFFYPQKPSCNSKGIGFTSVKLTDFKPVLDIISYGLLISLALFFFEIIVNIRIFSRQIMKKQNVLGVNE